MQEKRFFQALLFSVTNIDTIAVISIISMSAFAAPVTHQDQSRCRSGGSSTARSAFRGPENLRFQAVSNWLFQVSWLLTSPLVAHGVGSKDVDNRYICWVERLPIRPRGFTNTYAGSPLQPVPM